MAKRDINVLQGSLTGETNYSLFIYKIFLFILHTNHKSLSSLLLTLQHFLPQHTPIPSYKKVSLEACMPSNSQKTNSMASLKVSCLIISYQDFFLLILGFTFTIFITIQVLYIYIFYGFQFCVFMGFLSV